MLILVLLLLNDITLDVSASLELKSIEKSDLYVFPNKKARMS